MERKNLSEEELLRGRTSQKKCDGEEELFPALFPITTLDTDGHESIEELVFYDRKIVSNDRRNSLQVC